MNEEPLQSGTLSDAGVEISNDPRLTQTVIDQWNRVVRAVLKLKDDEKIPVDPYAGRYVRYAFDNRGLLAMPKMKGKRIKPHRSQKVIQRAKTFIEISKAALGQNLMRMYLEEAKRAEAAKEEIKPVTADQTAIAQKKALRRAERVLDHHELQQRRAVRCRQIASRRINAGLIQGNFDRAAHAGV